MELLEGKVYKIAGNKINVICDGKEYECTLRGKLKKEKIKKNKLVAVGDVVKFRIASASQGVIEKIKDRKNVISRPSVHNHRIEQILVANVEQLLITQSSAEPIFTTRYIDRALVIAENNNITPIICINKIDLCDVEFLNPYINNYKRMGYQIVLTSALKGEGIARLYDLLKDKITVLIGQSGVGKTSLINSMQPQLKLKTQEISRRIKKGKHTTSWVEMSPLDNGGFVIDTPGIEVFGLWGVKKSNLQNLFRDFRAMQGMCKFSNCLHYKENQCAIKIAVKDNLISEERYNNYVEILEELMKNS